MHSLAVGYSNLNQHQKAAKLNAEISDIRKKVLGPEHPDTKRSKYSLAIDYANLHKYYSFI